MGFDCTSNPDLAGLTFGRAINGPRFGVASSFKT